MHPMSEEQVFSGLAGVIVVEGLTERLPRASATGPRPRIALKDLQVRDGAIVDKNIDSNAPTTRTVNGLVDPVLRARTSQTQLLRLANICADIWYRLALDGSRFRVIAEDANPVGRVWTADELVLPPGKRYDVLVRWPRAGRLRCARCATAPGRRRHIPTASLATVATSGRPVARPPGRAHWVRYRAGQAAASTGPGHQVQRERRDERSSSTAGSST